MIKVKVFYGASIVEKLNDFLSTVKVMDVKYQMTDDNDAFMVIYEDSINLSEIPTCKLVEELKKREGVITHEIAPHEQKYRIECLNITSELNEPYVLSEEIGPAIILEVID